MTAVKVGNYYPGLGGDWDLDGSQLKNAADPVLAQDLATKNYVDSVIQVVTVRLTATQIKALFTTPVTLIAAPGLGKTVAVLKALFSFNWGSVQYAAGGAASLIYHGGSTNVLGATLASTFFTNPTAAITNDILLGSLNTAVTAPQNTGIDISVATANFTTGDSTVDVTVWYHVV